MRPKSKIPPCRYCSKTFQRSEHLLRHERTHTKEKPFRCRCGQSFSRKDLLARHHRIHHDGDDGVEVAAAPAPSSELGSPGDGTISVAEDGSYDRYGHNHDGASPPVLSQLVDPAQEMDTTAVPLAMERDEDNLDFLWGYPGLNSTFSQYSTLNYPMNFLSFPEYALEQPLDAMSATLGGRAGDLALDGPGAVHEEREHGALSRYGSRLPSPIDPDTDHLAPSEPRPPAAASQPIGLAQGPRSCPWRISPLDYQYICTSVYQQPAAMYGSFKMPSRHGLKRFVEGYFSGFHEHLPFLHLPTIKAHTLVPELILAIAAVGAQYRFQATQARQLSKISRQLIFSRITKISAHDTVYQRTGLERGIPTTCQPTEPLPPADARDSQQSQQQASDSTDETRTTQSPWATASSELPGVTKDETAQLLQAMILMIALGTWNSHTELREALPLGTQMAVLIREIGLSEPTVVEGMETDDPVSWEEWTRLEGYRRTMFVAYSFLGLHSITYNYPPQILNREIDLNLPSDEILWRAETADQWAKTQQRSRRARTSFRNAYRLLFGTKAQSATTHRGHKSEGGLSSFGNYVMIHSILQDIYFARQAMSMDVEGHNTSLPQRPLDTLERALGRWQRSWEATEDSSIDPSSPGGPLSFNSTALFRIAYVRLHADYGAYRRLETRDPAAIVRGFISSPPLEYSIHVCRAVLQCAHSLSIPVRIGLEFVARTQTFNWSIVHSLCNLECAVFLSQWLDGIATNLATKAHVPSAHEQRLLKLIHDIVSETDNMDDVMANDAETNIATASDANFADGLLAQRYHKMAIAMLRIGSHTLLQGGGRVWDISGVIGEALEQYANLLENRGPDSNVSNRFVSLGT